MKIIKRNAIRCKNCGDVIESVSRHDYRECRCGRCFVDGGHSYIRIGGVKDDIEVLTEYKEVPGCHIKVFLHYGGVTEFDIPMSELKKIIYNYEGMWHYIIAKDENGKEVYRTDGVDKFENKHSD